MLGLRTFLTTGEKESRARTFKHGWKAPQCAGRIHTDFERGFIRAEVIAHEDLLTWVHGRRPEKQVNYVSKVRTMR